MRITDTLLIGFDRDENGDNPVLIVGTKKKGHVVNIINAFDGDEAVELYNKLITTKDKKASDD